MNSSRSYNANPVLNKWEEERFQRLMANRVNNATSSLNTGKSALRRRSARAAARPRDMLTREIGQLEELLQSSQQPDGNREERERQVQKRLQRVKQIACLAQSSKKQTRTSTNSAKHHHSHEHQCLDNSNMLQAPSIFSCTSGKTTIPTYGGPQELPNEILHEHRLTRSHENPSHEQNTYTYYHPQPEQHDQSRYIHHYKPHRGKVKPSWDTSFAAGLEDGYVPNVRNRKLLHDPSTSKIHQQAHARRVLALSASASPTRTCSRHSSTVQQHIQQAPHATAGSHAALQRVLRRREQRAERRSSATAAASTCRAVHVQAVPPARRLRNAHPVPAVEVVSVTSAIHPAAAGRGVPAGHKRFSSVPTAAGKMQGGAQTTNGGLVQQQSGISGKVHRCTTDDLTQTVGRRHSVPQNTGSWCREAVDAAGDGETDMHIGTLEEAKCLSSDCGRPRTPRLKPSDKPTLQDCGFTGFATPASATANAPTNADAALEAFVDGALEMQQGDSTVPDATLGRLATENPEQANHCASEEAAAGSDTQPQAAMHGKDEMLERARARVGFCGLPAGFMFDRLAAAAGTAEQEQPQAAGGDSGSSASAARAVGSSCGSGGSGAAARKFGSRTVGPVDVGRTSAHSVVQSEVGESGMGAHHDVPAHASGGGSNSGSFASESYATTGHVPSDDLNGSFRHVMLRQMAGERSGHGNESAISSCGNRHGTARSSGAGAQSGVGWGRKDKEGEAEASCVQGFGKIGAGIANGLEGDCGSLARSVSNSGKAGDACSHTAELESNDEREAARTSAAGHNDGSATGQAAAAAEGGNGNKAGGSLSCMVQRVERGESREEGGVLHTFVAESQESLKSLRTLLTRSREGLHRGVRAGGPPPHSCVSDHGDIQPQSGGAPAQADAVGDVPGARSLHARVGAVPACAQECGLEGAEHERAASEESSPARSLTALPAREVHAGRTDMLILQRPGADYARVDSAPGPCCVREGAVPAQESARSSRSGRYFSDEDTGSHISSGEPHRCDYPEGAAASAAVCGSAAKDCPGSPDVLDSSPAVPLQLRHAQAVLGEIALRYGLDAPDNACSTEPGSAEWAAGRRLAGAAGGSGMWAIMDGGNDGHAADWMVSGDGGTQQGGASPIPEAPGGPMHALHSGDVDAAAQLYGPALAGTPATGDLGAETSLGMLHGIEADGPVGSDADGGLWVPAGEDGLDGVGEEYSDLGVLDGETMEEDGSLLCEVSGAEYGSVLVGGGGIGFVGMNEPGVQLLWSEVAGSGMCGVGAMQPGVYRSAQECTQIELIEDGEDI